MKKPRVMLVGAVGGGKTTLVKALSGAGDGVAKTQSVEYRADSIDTPGEFMENPFYYRALLATSLEADIILFVQDATGKLSIFPPGFAGAFSRRTMGAVTKIDHPEADSERARRFLQSLGLKGPVIAVSAFSGEGIDQLKQALNWD